MERGGRFVTTVLQRSEQDVVETYHAHNSMAKEHLNWLKRSDKVEHYFGVDATDLNSTATKFADDTKSTFDRVVFCYPFPTSNGGIMERQALLQNFFQSVRDWKHFDTSNGQIILGLKSTIEQQDYQLDYWNVETIARSTGFGRVVTSEAMSTFWRATHVNGRPLNKVKHIFDDRNVKVKFYAFQQGV